MVLYILHTYCFFKYTGYHAPRRGHPLEMVIQPRGVALPVRDPAKSKAVAVAAGRAHALALTNDGDVFSLGNNAYGQCGRQGGNSIAANLFEAILRALSGHFLN